MNHDTTSYINGSAYEVFMHRAHQKYDHSKNDRKGSAMQNAIDAENGENHVKHLAPFEKQFEKLKTNINKALDKYIANKKLKPEVVRSIAAFKSDVDNATGTNDLMLVINQTLELTPEIKVFR